MVHVVHYLLKHKKDHIIIHHWTLYGIVLLTFYIEKAIMAYTLEANYRNIIFWTYAWSWSHCKAHRAKLAPQWRKRKRGVLSTPIPSPTPLPPPKKKAQNMENQEFNSLPKHGRKRTTVMPIPPLFAVSKACNIHGHVFRRSGIKYRDEG